jgi:hypothetical protein
MKRDMSLTRALSLKLETLNENPFRPLLIRGATPELAIEGASADQIDYHLRLLREKRLTEPLEGGTMDGGVYFRQLTWDCHDFLDSIRDEAIWRKTRGAAEEVGGWTFDLIKDLAKGFIKKANRT